MQPIRSPRVSEADHNATEAQNCYLLRFQHQTIFRRTGNTLEPASRQVSRHPILLNFFDACTEQETGVAYPGNSHRYRYRSPIFLQNFPNNIEIDFNAADS